MDSIADSSSNATGIYSPLGESDEIRLLCLQPRVSGGLIRCTLKHTWLSSKIPYEALSYMWGPQEFRTIEINGKLCHVRINLWQALSHLCLENRCRTIWIDALCINQADINERNHQVMQMGKIYRDASRVVVWLGESDSASSTAMEKLQEAGLGRESGEAYCSLFGNYSTDTLNNIHSLFHREYWSRLWIVQEVTLAREVIIQCGPETIAWGNVESLLSCIETIQASLHNNKLIPPIRPRLHNNKLIPAIEPRPRVPNDREVWIQSFKRSTCAQLSRRRWLTKEMDQIGNNCFPNSSQSLLYLCSDHGGANCTDPRDKIFGFLALTLKCCVDAIPVDYSLSLFQISTRVLSHHGLSHSRHSSLDIVSTSRKFHDKLGISPDLVSKETAEAPTGALPLKKPYDEPSFLVNGTCSGHISFINSPSQEESSSNPPPNLSFKIWQHLHAIGQRLKQSSTTCVQVPAQLDLVFPIGVDLAYSTKYVRKTYRYPVPPTDAISLSNYLTRISPIKKSDLPTDYYYLYAFQQLVKATRNIVSPHSGLGIRLAFEENGAMILVPNTAKIGDILCTFAFTDTLAILRPSQETKNKYYLVGRAVFFYRSQAPLSTLTDRRKLEIDFRTLQMLTLASQHPDNVKIFFS